MSPANILAAASFLAAASARKAILLTSNGELLDHGQDLIEQYGGFVHLLQNHQGRVMRSIDGSKLPR